MHALSLSKVMVMSHIFPKHSMFCMSIPLKTRFVSCICTGFKSFPFRQLLPVSWAWCRSVDSSCTTRYELTPWPRGQHHPKAVVFQLLCISCGPATWPTSCKNHVAGNGLVRRQKISGPCILFCRDWDFVSNRVYVATLRC